MIAHFHHAFHALRRSETNGGAVGASGTAVGARVVMFAKPCDEAVRVKRMRAFQSDDWIRLRLVRVGANGAVK